MSDELPPMPDHYCTMSPRLHLALYQLVERLGDHSLELLGAVGSIGDTLPDDECAFLIQDWLETGKIIHASH